MKTSPKGIHLLQIFEGCKLTAYQCRAGVWTIGYGHTAGVKPGDVITKAQATAFLRADIAWAEAAVNRLVKVPLTQGQFDALVCLVFNIGEGAFAKSTLLRLLNGGDYAGACEQFAVWNRVKGKSIVGLSNRRRAEARVFNG